MSDGRDFDHPIVKTYDTIVEGNRVQLLFMTNGEATSFRTMLYQYKQKIEDAISSYDDDFKKMALTFERASKDAFLFNVYLKEAKPKVQVKLTVWNEATQAWDDL